MADALRASCAAPVFKRPRLDFSSCESDTLISFESAVSEERFSVDSGLQEDSYEVTSSSDSRPENNGDAPAEDQGFCSPDLYGVHTTSENFQQNTFENIPQTDFFSGDPSHMLAHESFNGTGMSSHPETAIENDTEDQESTTNSMTWVQRQITSGLDPRVILGEIMPKGTFIPQNVNDGLLWRYILNMLHEPKRTKLTDVNTLDDVVRLLRTCKNIIVLTGAGVSVSCGIPDFRSKNGVYARLSKDYPDLPDPQAMFDINYFKRDPRPFFKFANEIYPGLFQPSPSHRFIKLLEKQGRLLRNYTQNIDTLEHAAGIQNVITCHGSFATATCTVCPYKVDSSFIKDDIFNQRIPYCPACPIVGIVERGIMKPDIVFFGEGLSDEFHDALSSDKGICDLLIVMGSSLKVRPVAMIPSSVPTTVPQILINREPLKHLTFDIELLGDCDIIIGELCRRMESEWTIDEDIPRSQLQEVTLPSRPVFDPMAELPNLDATDLAEVNNNLEEAPVGASNLPLSEESNSCDYRHLSAIKLDDSEDGSSQEQPSSSGRDTEALYKSFFTDTAKDNIAKKLPDQSYLFCPPSRYIFQGAEIDNDDDSASTATDYSSDSESPAEVGGDAGPSQADACDKSPLLSAEECVPGAAEGTSPAGKAQVEPTGDTQGT